MLSGIGGKFGGEHGSNLLKSCMQKTIDFIFSFSNPLISAIFPHLSNAFLTAPTTLYFTVLLYTFIFSAKSSFIATIPKSHFSFFSSVTLIVVVVVSIVVSWFGQSLIVFHLILGKQFSNCLICIEWKRVAFQYKT